MSKKISTIEDLGDAFTQHGVLLEKQGGAIEKISDVLLKHVEETRENFKSIGDHLVSIESRLEELAEIARLRNQIERIQQNIREKLHVEV